MSRKLVKLVRRYHLLTYVVTFFAAICLVLIMVPGQAYYSYHNSRLDWWDKQCDQVYQQTQAKLEKSRRKNDPLLTVNLYEHGWPKPWLIRSTAVPAFGNYYQVASTPLFTSGKKNSGFLGPSLLADYVAWSNYDNWPFHSVEWRIHAWHLAFDLLIFLAVVGGTSIATERWLRSRGGLFRFRLVDLLAALTVCGVVFGWFSYHARMTRLEVRVAEYGQIGDAPGYRRISTWKAYSGPDWLKRLVGDDDYLPFLYHVHEATFHASKDWRESLNKIVSLPRLERLHMDLPVPQEVITRFRESANITEITLTANTAYSDLTLSRFYVDKETPRLGPENIEAISVLRPRVVTLRERMFLPEDVERLLAVTSLDRLYLRFVSITPDEVEELKQRYPSTSITATWGPSGPPSADDETTRKVREKREKTARQPVQDESNS